MPGVSSYYDKPTRHILGKLEIFFDGYENEPITIDMSNYLIDYQVVEEASAEDKNPLGAISANELTFTLTNFNSIFSPSNVNGPYYGKIKTGVMVKPYIKPGDDEVVAWTPLGVYFVSDWNSKMGSATAFVTCYDVIQELLLSSMPDLDVKLNVTFTNYIKYVLSMYGFANAEVDETLSALLPYGFVAYNETPDILQAIVEASMSVLMTTRLGSLAVKKLRRGTPVATFTDSNQLISVDVEQSIIKTYNGVKLTYVIPQLSEDREVLVVDNLGIPTGKVTHNLIKYSKPVFNISAVTLSGTVPSVIEKYTSTNFGITLVTRLNAEESASSKLSVTGKNIDLVEQELNDDLANMLEVYNPYIQVSEYADNYKASLTNFVNADIPVLELTVRGNPDITIGDTVEVHSNKYKIDFVGIVKRTVLKYSGNLTCNMTLLNAEVIV